MATLKKIAEITGVSLSTVSRVLNNPDYRCSSPEIRDKIWEAAMELKYVPNKAAKNLKMGKGILYWCNHDQARGGSDRFILFRAVESDRNRSTS